MRPVIFGNQKYQTLESLVFSEILPDICRSLHSWWHGSQPIVIAIIISDEQRCYI